MAWHARDIDLGGNYATGSQESIDNANEMANLLAGQGWSIAAICAFLGNNSREGGYNPWSWQLQPTGLATPTYSEFLAWTDEQAKNHGYGLVGFTPAKRYINSENEAALSAHGYAPHFRDSAHQGAATDGEAQTAFLFTDVPTNWSSGLFNYYNAVFTEIGVDIRNFYYITFEQFKTGKIVSSDIPLDYLTGAFELKYEKPYDKGAASSYQGRCSDAAYWYEYFTGHPPTPTPTTRKLKIWMPMNAWT